MTGTDTLRLEEVTVRFGGVVALNAVSLTLPLTPGVSALIGPNGAGKTTLLNVLTGVVRPSAGRILFEGSNITGRRADQVFRAGIARTFQSVRLAGRLTAEQNVQVAARAAALHGVAGGWIGGLPWQQAQPCQRAASALHRVGLPECRWALRPHLLSLSERRLVEIARALTGEPRLLLFDEPAAGMNTAEKQALQALLADLATACAARIVVVEHDMPLVMALADRVWVMNFGTLLAEGTPAQVQGDEAVIEAYLGHRAAHA